MTGHGEDKERNMSSVLLLAAGLLFLAAALVFNEALIGLLDANPPLAQDTKVSIRLGQINLVLAGLVLLVLPLLCVKVPSLAALSRRKGAVHTLLIALILLGPPVMLELAFRPSAARRTATTHYLRDPDLGWRLRPNARYRVYGKPVTINSRGLRGPERDPAKPPGVRRILFLGDSVTFGCGVDDEHTFPRLVETLLNRGGTGEVECINAGVGGYSPWQEDAWLRREGIRYDPDLVVVSIVLNDVTEKFVLTRFGGHTEGAQLSGNVAGPLDRLRHNSGLFYALEKIKAFIRFGFHVGKGAREEDVLNVRALVHHPDRPDVRKAWEVTLENMDKLFAFCRERDLPVLLVVFPFAFQLEDPAGLSGPQEVLAHYAAERGIPLIDLLPLLAGNLTEEGTQPGEYFVDADHLSRHGSETVSKILADRIGREYRLGED